MRRERQLGSLFVISGPSGAGKTTLRRRVLTRMDALVYSVSCTTRPPRPGEIHGRDYEFVSQSEFEGLIGEGAFLEWAWVFGHGYGTLRRTVLREIHRGQDVLLEIDVQGAAQIRRRARSLGTRVYYLFILPPSLEDLRERLRRRGTEDPEMARERLEGAWRELTHAPLFDYLVINRDVHKAVEAISQFIQTARGVQSM